MYRFLVLTIIYIKERLHSYLTKLIRWQYKIISFILLTLLLTSCIQQDKDARLVDRRFSSQIKASVFKSNSYAWLLTDQGVMWHTRDHGTSWKRIEGNHINEFRRLSFIDTQSGWAITENGQVWRTIDCGESWTYLSSLQPNAEPFMQIEFIDSSHGWIINPFSIWRTENGGKNWEMHFPVRRENYNGGTVHRFFFVNPQIGLLGGDEGAIYRTQDGGKTWHVKNIAPGDALFDNVIFVNERIGWVNSWPPNRLYRTNDGGNSWRLQPLPSFDGKIIIKSVHFIDENRGWVAGYRSLSGGDLKDGYDIEGLVLHTLDGGRSWQPVEVGKGDPFYVRIYFTDEKHGWLVARENVYHTDNSGRDWRLVAQL